MEKAKPICSLCLKKITRNKSKYKNNEIHLCRICNRRYIVDDAGFVRKKRNMKSPSKLQRSVRLALLEIFKPFELCEDVFFSWNKSDTGALLQYDFYIPALNILIEVQGQHHYKKVGKFKMTDQDLYNVKKRDHLKEQRAVQRGFSFYTIKYDENYRDAIIHIYNSHIKEMKNGTSI